MTAYYNEYDKQAAAWLRDLISAGHIAPGIVDERSIEDVHPNDLRGFVQCHFFAGIGVWSHALRRARWPDDRPVWTGSCPCQPFSEAGAGAGFADERHLWPALFHLIEQRKPATVLGEQVASKDADPWIDLVQTDLEAVGYGVGAIAFPAAGVGAPNIRDRTYWMAHADRRAGRKGRADLRGRADRSDAQPWAGSGRRRVLDGLADAAGSRLQGGESGRQRPDPQQPAVERGRPTGGLEHAGHHHDAGQVEAPRDGHAQADRPADQPSGSGFSSGARPGPSNGFWSSADWLLCRDAKWRPIEPGTFPLADGAPARVGRLRGYGNALNAEAARIWIEIVSESIA